MATNLTHMPAQMRASLEAAGADAALTFENEKFDLVPADELPADTALSLLRWQRDRVEKSTRDTVRRAREDGLSWRQIGDSLGISAQGARQRFGKTAA